MVRTNQRTTARKSAAGRRRGVVREGGGLKPHVSLCKRLRAMTGIEFNHKRKLITHLSVVHVFVAAVALSL